MEFSLKTTIDVTAEEIFNAWLSSDGHTKMTGGNASITDKVGSKFTAWNGYIKGMNIAVQPYERIVQSWRTSQFKKEEEDSQLEILFEQLDGRTEITLKHTKVPESGAHYINGWDVHYFQPMKKYFPVIKNINEILD